MLLTNNYNENITLCFTLLIKKKKKQFFAEDIFYLTN